MMSNFNDPKSKVALNFPRMLDEVSFRFVTVSPDPFSGFRIKVFYIGFFKYDIIH